MRYPYFRPPARALRQLGYARHGTLHGRQPPKLYAFEFREADDQPSSDMWSHPSQPSADLRVVAALFVNPDADSLRSLCVAVVRPFGGGFTIVARVPEDRRPEPPSDVDHVTCIHLAMNAVPYRLAPVEVALLWDSG